MNSASKHEWLSAICLAGLIFILSVLTSHRYGYTWDAGWDLYLSGRNLRYALTFDPVWMNFDKMVDFEIEGKTPYFGHNPYPWRTLQFGAMLANISGYVLFEKLNLLGSISAYYLPNKLLFAAMLMAIFIFVRREFDLFVAVAAVVAVAFQPRLWAHMQFNLKDFPYVCFMALTIIALRSAILKRLWKRFLLAAALLGLTAATRPNAALMLIIISLWYFFARSSVAEVEGRAKKRFFSALAVAPFIVVAVYFLVWPYLWIDPVGHFGKFITYYTEHAAIGPPHFQWDKLYYFIAVQPPALLLFGALGVAISIGRIRKGEKRELNVLLLIWFLLPVLRVLLPRVRDYDGVRHFIEYAVPLGIFAGVGLVYSCKWCHKTFSNYMPSKVALVSTILLAALLPSAWAYTSIKAHPNEIAYFNFTVGGTKGAQKRWNDATDYWGSCYRQGMNWLNENAEQGALVTVPVASHVVFSTRKMWLRDDLNFLGVYMGKMSLQQFLWFYETAGRPTGPVYFMYITRVNWYTDLVELLEKKHMPIHSIKVGGAPILKIFRLNSVGELAL